MAGDALLGREMGRYRIESIIGSGGFATVYRAIDLALERPIALKVVDPTAHRNPTIGRRFVLEGRAVASLDHPAVVPVYDAGESDGVLWMAMRLITGGSLDDALVAGRRFTFEQVAAVAARIGDALDHAHGHGIVHRDVKPSNILLEQNDPARAWLADFGIAATTRTAGRYTTGALGTAAYMAPEQARPSSVGPPADLYSLACVIYELLTRRRPFPGDDYVELLVAHATHPVPPTVWPRVDAFLQRALAKDPTVRPSSGRAFAEELRRTLVETERTRPAPPPSPRPAPEAPASPGTTAPAVPAASPPSPASPASATSSPSPAVPDAAAPAVLAASSPSPAAPSPGAEARSEVAVAAAGGPDAAPAGGAGAAGASAHEPEHKAGSGAAIAPPAAGRPPAPPPYRPGDPLGTTARATTPDDGGAAAPKAQPGVGQAPDPVTTEPATDAEALVGESGSGGTNGTDRPVAASTGARPAPPRRDEPPTVVEHVDRTLEHPHLRLPPPPASPATGWSSAEHRPSPPGSPPGGLRPPPPAPRDPTVARSSRRRGRRRLIAGGALLVIGIVAVAVALLEQRNQDDTDTVADQAGIRYEVPTDWEADTSQLPLVVFEVDGARTATVTHRPTDDAEVADQLAEGVDRDVCGDGTVTDLSVDGADQVAECTNTSPDLPRRAVGAIANGELWVITVEQTTDVDEGDAFIDSIEFEPPG